MQGNNFIVVDVWDSMEKFTAFGEKLNPIFSKLGIAKTNPVITTVHYEYSGAELGVLH